MRQTPNVLEVQERTRRLLSPCQGLWGSDLRRKASLNYHMGKYAKLSTKPIYLRETVRAIVREVSPEGGSEFLQLE